MGAMTGHGSHHTHDVDWAEAVAHLDRSAAALRPVDEAVVDWLAVPVGSRVADVGCGAGGMAAALASAVGAGGEVVAVDGEPALLDATIRRADQEGVGDRVRPVRHDLSAGPPPLADLDLVWAGHVVHHLPDQQAGVDALTAALAPGGRLALAEGGWSGSQLPWDVGVGEPGLENRLHAAVEQWFADMRRDLPGAVRMPYGWSAALSTAGLTAVGSRTFLLELPTPLDVPTREHAVASLTTQVERVRDRLSDDDVTAWERLLDPDDGATLARREDLHRLAAHTVHVGTRS